MPNSADNIPTIIGGNANIPALSTAVPLMDYSGFKMVDGAANTLSRGIFDLTGSLVNLKNEEDMTTAKRALVDANNEMDAFLAEAQQLRGANAAGLVEKFQQRSNEIREKHSRDLDGVGKKVFELQYDNGYGGNFSRILGHQQSEADRAASYVNKEMAESYSRRLENDPNDDDAFDNYMSILDAEHSRIGVDAKDRPALRDDAIQQIGMSRIAAQLKVKNVQGAKMLLDRMKPDGNYRFKLNSANFERAAAAVNAQDKVATLYRSVDGIFSEASSKVNIASGNPDEMMLAGKQKIRELFTGPERDKALELYNAREREYRDMLKGKEDAFFAGMRSRYAQLSYSQAREALDTALLKIQNPVIRERAEQEMRKWYGADNADALANRDAMEKTMVQVKTGNLNAGDARNAFIAAGGNCDDKSLAKLEEVVRNRENLPEISLVSSASTSFGYDAIPGGFMSHLSGLSMPGKKWDFAAVRREMADYLAAEVYNENWGWLPDTKSNLGAMQSATGEIYFTESQARKFFDTYNQKLMSSGKRQASPTPDNIVNFMARRGFILNSSGLYRRDKNTDKISSEAYLKQIKKEVN